MTLVFLLSVMWYWEKAMATHSSNSCLGSLMDGGDWRAAVHGVAELDMTE